MRSSHDWLQKTRAEEYSLNRAFVMKQNGVSWTLQDKHKTQLAYLLYNTSSLEVQLAIVHNSKTYYVVLCVCHLILYLYILYILFIIRALLHLDLYFKLDVQKVFERVSKVGIELCYSCHLSNFHLLKLLLLADKTFFDYLEN